MRKKQLYAIILAGALTAGSVPGTVFAAEATAVPTAAETPAAEMGEGGETTTPAEPETPVTPEASEPTAPVTPETPEPTVPATPEAPAAPTTPEAPQNTETPGATETPATPTQPAAPETPTASPEAPQKEAPAAEEPSAGEPTDPEAGEPTDPKPDDKPEGYSEDPTGVYISFVDESGVETKKEYYLTLQNALNAAIGYYQAEDHDKNKAVVVKIEEQFSLSETVKIENGKINLVATKDISIVRGIDANDPSKMLLGNMFEITGPESELQLSTEGEGKLSISGKNPGDGSQPVTGSLISVSNNGGFGMSGGVVLFENSTTADGSAIHASGTENVVLQGGVITGNTGAKGAVYTDKNICMQGSVQIKDNFNAEKANANLYLDQDAKVLVTDVLKDSEIHVTSAKAADKAVIAQAGTKTNGTALTEEEFKTVPEQLKYDDEKTYSVVLGEDKLTAVLKAAKEPEPSVSPSITPGVSPSVTPSPTVTPTKTPSFLTYKSKTLKWLDHTTVIAKMNTTKDCKWYYFFVDAGTDTATIKKMYDPTKAKHEVKANTDFTVKAENVPEKDSWLVVAAKPNSGSAQLRVLKLSSSSRPAAPTVEPTVTTRAKRTYDVSESKVTGLEEPLKFFPRKFYDFQVVGAGQNDTNPISGDERWIPQYWAMSVNGAKNTSWRIGSQEKGIREAAEYPLYIFFKKETYNGKEWIDTDVVEYMKTSFRSAKITDEEWNAYIDDYNAANPEDGLNYDGTSAGSVADLTPTEAASEQDTGATTRSAADTADTAPIGSMSALAALSLLAGGYVIVRKRKKEEI